MARDYVFPCVNRILSMGNPRAGSTFMTHTLILRASRVEAHPLLDSPGVMWTGLRTPCERQSLYDS